MSGEDGWGVCVGNFHLAGTWPKELIEAHMLFKEILPVAIVISLLSPVLPDTVFGVAVDNTGAAFAVNKLTCRDAISRRLIQQLASDLDSAGHTALAAHVRRHRNVHADDMSYALEGAEWRVIIRQHESRAGHHGPVLGFPVRGSVSGDGAVYVCTIPNVQVAFR